MMIPPRRGKTGFDGLHRLRGVDETRGLMYTFVRNRYAVKDRFLTGRGSPHRITAVAGTTHTGFPVTRHGSQKMEETTNQKKQKERLFTKNQRIILAVALSALVIVMVAAGCLAFTILKKPQALFEPVALQTASAAAQPTPKFNIEGYLPTEEPGASQAPGSVVSTEKPDTPQTATPMPEMDHIVNIALFGIDAFENGKTTSGSMPHTDANLVLAINFDTNEVSLISLARDCMTTAPGYLGIYKFNGIFNVGGGMKDPAGGFDLSRRALEEWFGGITIPYYYALDFQALIDLVDAIGGIDYNLDIPITTFSGKTIGKGQRHLDGEGVMAYVRMRQSVTGGLDSKRTERQRKMLLAIFKKLKQENLFSKVPELLQIMSDDIYTNTTIAQTTALVNFAKGVDPDSIKTYSIQGEMACRYEWRYCFIDQQKRIEILREVYGFEAEPIGLNSKIYEDFLHQSGFEAMKYLNITKKIFNAAHSTVDESKMTEEQKTKYAVCWKDYTDLLSLFEETSNWVQAHYARTSFSDEDAVVRDRYYAQLKEREAKLRESADALNTAFDKKLVSKTGWTASVKNWPYKGSDVNEVYVDFR